MKSNAFPKTPVVALLIGALFCAPAGAVMTKATANNNARHEEQKLNQLIVKYRADNAARFSTSGALEANGPATRNLQFQAQRLNAVQSVSQAFGATAQVQRQLATGGWVYRVSKNLAPADMRKLAAKLAAADSSIEYAEPDYIYRPTFIPNDPYYATNQWDMQDAKSQAGALNLPAAWDIAKGDGIVVAVVDTGYRPHPDLVANLVPAIGGKGYGYNFISDPARARLVIKGNNARGPDGLDMGDWSDGSQCAQENSTWHGTHVAGTVAAVGNNGVGISGVAPNAKVLPLRVLGMCGGTNSDIADAVAWAAGLPVNGAPQNPTPANVISLSLGGLGVCTRTSATAFQSAISTGAVITVAAGNSNFDAKLSSPANCPGVVTVASSSIAGGRSGYSNYGGTVSVAAPGGGFTTPNDMIWSTLPTGATVSTDDTTYGMMAGTSQATPHVAGVAALMLSANPKLTPDKVKSILIKTARPAPANCPGCGSGIVDAAAAVAAAKTAQ